MSSLVLEVLENVFTNLLDRLMFGSLISSLAFSIIYPIVKRMIIGFVRNINNYPIIISDDDLSRNAWVSSFVGFIGVVVIGWFLGLVAAPFHGGLFARVWIIIFLQVVYIFFIMIAPVYFDSIKYNQFLKRFSIALAVSMMIIGAIGIILGTNNLILFSEDIKTVIALQCILGMTIIIVTMNWKSTK